MSRIGKQPVTIPNGVTVTLGQDTIEVKGPKGELSIHKPEYVTIEQKDNSIIVTIPEDKKENKVYRSFHGLARSLVNNMIIGVSEGYKKELEMKGIGYRAQVQADSLILSVGYSHQVAIAKIEGITFTVTDNVNITVEGIDKQKVGQVSADIRSVRKPEPYKGKGIKYKNELIRRKAGKGGKGAKAGK